MSLILVGGGKQAPGATTTAIGLGAVWPSERRLVVEADPDGGVLAARFGLSYEPGLVSLAAATRRELSEADLAAHTQDLEGGLGVVCAPSAPDQMHAALEVSVGALAARLASLGEVGVFVDVGRAWPAASVVRPLVEAADAVIVVCRPHLDELTQLVARWRAFGSADPPVGVVLVGDRPYSAAEVAETLPAEDRARCGRRCRSTTARLSCSTGSVRAGVPRRGGCGSRRWCAPSTGWPSTWPAGSAW